jgi:flavin-dependent dehydrogenase
MRDRYDVIVVGARVGGAVLAALLGDRGISVLLVDAARFGTTTPSTHFFRGAGLVGVLDRLRVLDRVLALGPPPLARELNYADGAAEPVESPPQDPGEIGFCLSVRRAPLDSVLVERARSADSVDVVEATTVGDLLWADGRVAGVQLADGRAVHAGTVVGADGRNSMVASRVAPEHEDDRPPCRALYYHYFKGLGGADGAVPDAAEFSLLGDEIAYLFPSDAGLTCVAVSVNLDTFEWMRADLEDRLAERIAEHRGLAARVDAAEVVTRAAGRGPGRSYVRVPWGPGWALVGDAGMHQDPWTGVGMDMAGVHATFLAEAIAELLDGVDERTALGRYHERRNAHGLVQYEETMRYAADLRELDG